MNTAMPLPLGAEMVPEPAPPGGAPPWQRAGASHRAPDDPQSRAKADQWRKRAAADGVTREERDEARRKRHADRRERQQAEEEKRVRALEANARRMYLLGFFALPLLWLVSILYFHKDFTSAQPNPVIKRYYKNSRFMLIVYTIIFVTWFVVFQVYSETGLKSLNIIFFTGQSPSGF